MTKGAAIDRHVPVMEKRCTELLAHCCDAIAARGGKPVIVDATVGMGGHTQAFLHAAATSVVIGVDRDPEALRFAQQRVGDDAGRFRPVHAVYDQFDHIIDHLEPTEELAGVFFDLGVSSWQLDEVERGFAYSYDAPLDMRMDSSTASTDPTAAELLATISASDLKRILEEYGEERFSGRISRHIIEARQREPLRTTGQLAQVIDRAIPAPAKRSGGHPAKRSFQAIRIAVNRELETLARAVPQALDAVALGGRVAVLSYHSLEDRIVKRALTARTQSSAPVGLPVELEEHKPTFRLAVKGAETPTEEEISKNPRAASAKLRAVEKTRTAVGSAP